QLSGAIDTTVPPGSASASSTTTTTSANLITDPVTNQQVAVTLLIDTSSVPAFSDVQRMVNGQLIVSGSFLGYGASKAKGLVRLNSDGSVDSTFAIGPGAEWRQTTETATFHPAVDNVELQGNGQLLITGTFEAFNGFAAPGVA